MPAVESGLAAWLKSSALFTSSVPGGVAWGTKGVAVDIQLPVDLKTEAAAEGDRIAAFMGSPHVKDNVEVKGSRRDLLGRVVTLTGDRLGYIPSGSPCFVLGVAESNLNTTVLTVLRKLT